MTSDPQPVRKKAVSPGGDAGSEWLVEESEDARRALEIQLRLAGDVAIGIERTLKSFHQFGVRHKTSQGFVGDAKRKIDAFHAAYGELPLSVFGCDLLHEGESIYSDQELRQSFPFMLFRDGVQRVIFEIGVEAQEIQTFCLLLRDQSLLGTTMAMEEDLVTQLWDANLPHLRYVVSESFKQDDVDLASEERRKKLIEQLKVDAETALLSGPMLARFARATTELEAARTTEDLDLAAAWERGVAIVGDDAARAALAAEVDNDATLLRKFLEIVFSEILEQKDAALRGELVGFVRNFAVEATQRDRLPEAIGVLRALGDLARMAGDDGKKVAQEILAQIATPEVLAELMRQLEIADEDGTQQLLTFLALVPPRGSRKLVGMMTMVTQGARRRAVCQLLAERLGDDLAAVGEQFREADEGLAFDLIHLLKSSSSSRARVELLAALDHLSHNVRRVAFEAIRGSAAPTDPTLVGASLFLLEDIDQDLRRLALLSIPRLVDGEISKRLRALISRDVFDTWQYADKRRAFLAYASVSGRRSAKELLDVLQARTLFSNEDLDDRRCCAAFAIATLGDETQAAALETEAKRMFVGKRIKEACEAAVAVLKFKKPIEQDTGADIAPLAIDDIQALDTSQLPRPIWDDVDARTSLPPRASISASARAHRWPRKSEGRPHDHTDERCGHGRPRRSVEERRARGQRPQARPRRLRAAQELHDVRRQQSLLGPTAFGNRRGDSLALRRRRRQAVGAYFD